MNRDEFEDWYVQKYMAMMIGGKEAIEGLRNGAGYDNEHIDEAWEGWQLSENGIEFEYHIKVSAWRAFWMILLAMSLTGLLFYMCLSDSFYQFMTN